MASQQQCEVSELVYPVEAKLHKNTTEAQNRAFY